MIDSLNAEVSLGTIANVQEAIQWLGYTYLFGMAASVSFAYPLMLSFSTNAERTIHLWWVLPDQGILLTSG